MQVELSGDRTDSAKVLGQAKSAGLTLLDRSSTSSRAYLESPIEAIAKIEERTYSSLWDVDDATWAAVVEPALDRLRALPDLDRRRERSARQDLLTFAAR